MTKKEKLIYLAGIVDGEGHICLAMSKPGNSQKKYPSPMIIVSNTNIELMEWIKDNFGGNYYAQKTLGISRKTCYQWRIGHSKAVKLAKKLQKYLIVKKEQVKRIL